jgi:uncharacterized protein YgbK (DUF1537 family)
MRDDARLLLTYYGDDFTGSTDVLEALARAGLRTALFLEAPEPEQLASGRFAGLQAVGVAGLGRSMTPSQMDAALPSVFARIERLGARLFHYKVCSTFDSSPQVGSIGRAIDIGQRVFASPVVPLVVGAPVLRRYCLFGNLFATVGDATYRLDRHPTMSRHPVTPMDESDLRGVLARQTAKRTALMDILHLTGTPAELDGRFAKVLEDRPDIVLFDVLDDPRLAEVGRLIWGRTHTGQGGTLFAVGSSGLEYALTAHWRASGRLVEPEPFRPAGRAGPIAVISGSCSPVTAEQIAWARARGFAVIEVDASALVDPGAAPAARGEAVRAAVEAVGRGRSVVVCSAVAPDDPRIETTLGRWRDRGLEPQETRERIGGQLGRILGELLEATALRRVVVAGGDTSGHAVRQLGIECLEVAAPLVPGSPLCRASSGRASVDGLQIVLKGGQIGHADYFERVERGEA